ncbi:MAG: methyltransferase, partial [Chloroflexota bacterium]
IAAEMAGRTLAANGLDPARARVGLPAGPCDAVLLAAPRGRHLCRLLLWHAWETLRPGGQLYLGGLTDLGIKSVLAAAEALFGAAQVLGYKSGGRAVRLVRAAQAPDPLPAAFLEAGIAPGSYHQFEVSVGAQHYTLQTRPGVFAWQGLDDGTAMLLDHLTVGAEERVADVGCGHGLIGIHAARLAERGAVHLVDVDALAVECARRNAQVNLGRDLPVTLGDGLPALGVQNLTLIVSNPPFHAGRDVSLGMVHAIIEDAHERLERSGRLVLVANRFLRYQAPMHARFGNVEELAQSPQYHVLAAEKRHAKAPQSPRPPRGAHMVNRTRG